MYLSDFWFSVEFSNLISDYDGFKWLQNEHILDLQTLWKQIN